MSSPDALANLDIIPRPPVGSELENAFKQFGPALVEEKRKSLNVDRDRTVKSLESLELKDPFYRVVAQSAWFDITAKVCSPSHPDLPIQPRVFVIPENSKEAVSRLYSYRGHLKNLPEENIGGFFWPEYLLAVVFSNGNKVHDAMIVHHELNHGMARIAVVDFFDGQSGQGKADACGFQVSTRNGVARGKVLEEGVVTNQSLKFITSKFKQDFPDEYNAYVEKWRTNLQEHEVKIPQTDDEVCLAGLQNTMPESYKQASHMVGILTTGMQRYHPLGTIFEYDLLAARLRPKKIRYLTEAVDRVYGQGMMGEIFRAKFDDAEETKRIIHQLQI